MDKINQVYKKLKSSLTWDLVLSVSSAMIAAIITMVTLLSALKAIVIATMVALVLSVSVGRTRHFWYHLQHLGTDVE